MFFITNRAKKKGVASKFGRPFEFDLKDNTAGQSVYFCEALADGSLLELGSPVFFQRLRDASYEHYVLLIHGFNVDPHGALEQARHFQHLLDRRKPGRFGVISLLWPCDDDFGIIQDYFDDQMAADASGLAFARVLAKFIGWQQEQEAFCPKRISVLAHSMGARVLRNALTNWASDMGSTNRVPYLFKFVFLVAPDIVNESLEYERQGYLMTQAASQVGVYYASDDLALRGSKVANLVNRVVSRRLGHTGPENWERTPQNVVAIDCNAINLLYDPPRGHGYFLYNANGPVGNQPGMVFEHLYHTLITGRLSLTPPEARHMCIEQFQPL